MEHLIELAVFFGKFLIVGAFLLVLVASVMAIAAKNKHRPELEIQNINEKLDELESSISELVLSKDENKLRIKKLKKDEKAKSPDDAPKKSVFVLTFKGDIEASQVDVLSDQVTAILLVAKSGDSVVIKVESPGGTVHGYGLAAAQLLRLKASGLHLITSVDKIAASGGYMMASMGHKVVSAPFAIIGSIGVLAQVPNLHRFLKSHDVDYEEFTSGEYKKTVSFLGEMTEKGKEKFRQQLVDTHVLFKQFVSAERPQVDMAKVATGEYWFGKQALELMLVDEIKTSEDVLLSFRNTHKIFELKTEGKKKFAEKIADIFGLAFTSYQKQLRQKSIKTPDIFV